MTSSSPKHLSKFDSILWFWTKTGGTQFAAHCLRGAVIGRLEERWVQQGKPRLARRSFYLNQEKKSVLSTKPWSFWAEVLLDSPDHVQAPSCWLNQLTMALNWTYRAFFRELAHARAPPTVEIVLLRFISRDWICYVKAVWLVLILTLIGSKKYEREVLWGMKFLRLSKTHAS